MTVQLNDHSNLDLFDSKVLLKWVYGHVVEEDIDPYLVSDTPLESQVRNIALDPAKAEIYHAEALERLGEGKDPFYKKPLFERGGKFGMPSFKKIDGTHRDHVGYTLKEEGKINTYVGDVLPQGFFAAAEQIGVTMGSVQLALNPERPNPGQTLAEIESEARKMYPKAIIDKDVEKLTKYLLSLQTRYAESELKKLAKRIDKDAKSRTLAEQEAQTKFRRYSSSPQYANDEKIGQQAWLKNNWDDLLGECWAMNSSTSGMFNKLVATILAKLSEMGFARDKATYQYPTGRTDCNICFRVELTESNTTPAKMKKAYLEKVVTYGKMIDDHDLPVDRLYRYPHYTNIEDMEKPVLIWEKGVGKIDAGFKAFDDAAKKDSTDKKKQ